MSLVLIGRGAGEENDVVGLIGERAPHLRAVDDPATVLGTGGLAPNVGDIRSGFSLGQGEGAQVLTGGDLRQQPCFLFG